MSIGLDYLPKEVARRVNKNIAFGGGGGKTTSVQSIDPDIKRATLPALQQATKAFQKGDYGQVADQAGAKEAIEIQRNVANQALQGLDTSEVDAVNAQVAREGLGTENLLNALRSSEGQLMAGQQGALGSARADRAREAAMVDQSLNLTSADIAAKQKAGEGLINTRLSNQEQQQSGASALGQLANQGRALGQEALDADIKGAERYFGLLAGAPQGSTTTQTGGGK